MTLAWGTSATFDPCGCGEPRPARMSAACVDRRVCQGKNCSAGHCGNRLVDNRADAHHAKHGKLVLACTLKGGLCVQCARSPESEEAFQLGLTL